MSLINNAFTNSVLADAAYVDGIEDGFGGDNILEILTPTLTPTLAKFVSDNFTVLNQQGGYSSGFNAIVWRGNSDTKYKNQIYVSMRGTDEFSDVIQDKDLAITGLGHAQIVDMINWWLRVTTDSDKTACQIKIMTVQTLGMKLNYFLQDIPVPGLGLINDIENVKFVTGHSLGGYLATAFARIFGNQLPKLEINTFNSAGFGWLAYLNIEDGFNTISRLIGEEYGLSNFSNNQNNYYAENGVNFTTNDFAFDQKGNRIPLFQEASYPIQTYANHSMYKITDLLSLGNMMEKLYPDLSIEMLNRLIKGASSTAKDSYETVLDIFRKLLLGEYVKNTARGDSNSITDKQQPESRREFHANLTELMESKSFQDLIGKASFESLDTKTTVASIVSLIKANDMNAPISLVMVLVQMLSVIRTPLRAIRIKC